MELWLSLFSLIPFFFIALIPFAYLSLHNFTNGNKSAENARVPPGTSGLPLVGETLSFYLKLRKGAQLEFITERIQKYSSNIFRTSLMGEQVVVISGAEGNKFVFSNEGKLVQRWFPSRVDKLFPFTGGVHNNNNIWQRNSFRKTITPWILHVDGLQASLGIMDEVIKQHLEAYWKCPNEGGPVLVAEVTKRYTIAFLCKLFLGIDDLNEIEQFVLGMDVIESALPALTINIPGTAWSSGMKASKFLRSRIEAIVREKKRQQNGSEAAEKDFIAEMLLQRSENGEIMPVQNMVSSMLGFLEAGYLTVQSTITMLFMVLAEHPDVYASVLQEQREIASSKKSGDSIKLEDINKMKYSWNVVREVLRRYSPTPGAFRKVIEDITYQGFTIPKGWKIYWLPYSTQMDPKCFPNPEKFDPSRFNGDGPSPYTFLPFAAGLSMCPGYKLTKLQILTFLHYAITKYRWEKVVPHEKLLYSFGPYPAQGLPVRLHRHND